MSEKIEKLVCRHCKSEWTRPPIGGRKPKLCPSCLETHKFCHGCNRSLPHDDFASAVRADGSTKNPANRQGHCRECNSRRRSPAKTLTCGKCDSKFQRKGRGRGGGPRILGRTHLCDECELAHKWCPNCDRIRQINDFAVARDKRSGRVAHCKECDRARWAARSDDERRALVARKYGISVAEWDAMYLAQNGLCAICGQPPPVDSRGLVVDHDHDTGLVRALLCQKCNIGVGHFDDDPNLMRRAAGYIEQHSILLVHH